MANTYHPVWKLVYATYPPLLRVFERLRFHRGRQPFILGKLNEHYTADDLRKYLDANGFENAILAWRDDEEVLSMRKVDKQIFQYHIRLHSDGEVRGHYEYSSEGNPWKHSIEYKDSFRPEREFFVSLLEDYIKPYL